MSHLLREVTLLRVLYSISTVGTTWHSAGLVWSLRPNDTDSSILAHTLDLVKSGGEIEQLTG